MVYQLGDSVAGFAYSFGGTCFILFIMNIVPGLSLRASEEAEILGMDDAEIGEFAYDFVELTREVITDMDDPQGQYPNDPQGMPMGMNMEMDMHEKSYSPRHDSIEAH